MAISMRKIYGFILSVVMACPLLSSCVYDNLDMPCNSDMEAGYYMSLHFSPKQRQQSGVQTRTFQPSYEDEEFERKVSDFRIFLVNRNDPDAEVIELKGLEMKDEVTTKPFLIEGKYMHGYLLYVVANAEGSGFKPDLTSARAFRGTYIPGSNEACAQLWTPNHFLMVNANNEAMDRDTYIAMRSNYPAKVWKDPYPFVDTFNAPDGGVPIEIEAGKDYPYDNPYRVSVPLERVAAKIVVDCSEENFDFSGDKYKNKFYDVHVTDVALVNAANRFNLVQQWKVANYQGDEFFNYNWDKLKYDAAIPDNAPYGYPYLWAVTPMSDINSIPSEIYYNGVAKFTDWENEKLLDGAEDLFSPLDASGTKTMYCLENTSPLYLDFMSHFNKGVDKVEDKDFWQKTMKDGMSNRVTGVLFRVRAKIKDDSHSTGDLIDDPEEGDWSNAKTRSGEDDGYKTFYCYEDLVYTRLSELIKEKPVLAEKGITVSSSIKELRNAGVKVYEDGYMYYMHWIVDQNYQYCWNWEGEADEGKPFNYYAVLRNTRYVVQVKTVKDIGMDLPGREILLDVNRFNQIIEGEDYMLSPTNVSDLEFDKNDYLPYLKNSAL